MTDCTGGRGQGEACVEKLVLHHHSLSTERETANLRSNVSHVRGYPQRVAGGCRGLETEIPSFLQRAIFILYVILISYSFRVNILALESPHLFI